jgi:hypothetical protein
VSRRAPAAGTLGLVLLTSSLAGTAEAAAGYKQLNQAQLKPVALTVKDYSGLFPFLVPKLPGYRIFGNKTSDTRGWFDMTACGLVTNTATMGMTAGWSWEADGVRAWDAKGTVQQFSTNAKAVAAFTKVSTVFTTQACKNKLVKLGFTPVTTKLNAKTSTLTLEFRFTQNGGVTFVSEIIHRVGPTILAEGDLGTVHLADTTKEIDLLARKYTAAAYHK